MAEYKRIETKIIHAGEPSPRIEGAVAMPIFQSAMLEYTGETSYHDIKYIARLGISDSLIRLSVGIEATEDLIADFNQALQG